MAIGIYPQKLNYIYCTYKEVSLAGLQLPAIGVQLRSVQPVRGSSTSTMAISSTTLRNTLTMCGLFGLFNNLSI